MVRNGVKTAQRSDQERPHPNRGPKQQERKADAEKEGRDHERYPCGPRQTGGKKRPEETGNQPNDAMNQDSALIKHLA